jgi:hypothetical protein
VGVFPGSMLVTLGETVDPVTGTFGESMDPTLELELTSPPAISPAVTPGLVYAANYNSPTPANLNAAEVDFNYALAYIRGEQNPDYTDLGGGAISGLTIVPGLYKWNTAVIVRLTLGSGHVQMDLTDSSLRWLLRLVSRSVEL